MFDPESLMLNKMMKNEEKPRTHPTRNNKAKPDTMTAPGVSPELKNESLIESELKLALSQTADAVVVYDRELRYTYINSLGATLLGEKSDRIIGKSNRELIGDGADTMEPHIQRAVDTKEKVFVLHEIPLPEGDRVFDTIYTPVQDDKGEVTRVVGICRDVTQDKKRLRNLHDLVESKTKELNQTLSLLRATLESTDDGILVVDTEGDIVDYNRRLLTICRISEEAVDARKFDVFLEKMNERLKSPSVLLRSVNRSVTGSTHNDHDVLEFKNGNVVSLFAYPRQMAESVIGRVLSFHDITEQKRAETALRESEMKYRYLVENAEDIIYQTDTEGRVTFINSAAAKRSGYSSEEILGKVFDDFVHPDWCEEAARFYGGQYKDRIPNTYYELPVITKSGKTVWVGQNVRLIEEGDTVMGFRAFARDITKRKESEAALKRRDAILQTMSSISELTLKPASEQGEIFPGILERLGRTTEVSGVRILENRLDDDGSLDGKTIFRWDANPSASGLNSVTGRDFSYSSKGLESWKRTLLNGEVLYGRLPDFSGTEKAALKSFGIRSFVAVPVFVDEKWWGALVFSEKDRDRLWDTAEIEALKAAGGIIGAFVRHKKSGRALLESEERYSQATHAGSVGVWEADIVTGRIRVDKVLREILGYEEREMDNRLFGWLRKIHHGDRKTVLETIDRHLQGKTSNFENQIRMFHKKGRIRWFFLRGTALRNANGRIRRVTGTAMDITETKKAQEAIVLAKREWELTFDSVPDLISIIDDRFRIMRLNKAMANRIGVAPPRAIGLKCHDCFDCGETPPSYCPHAKALETGEEQTIEIPNQCFGGEFLVTVSPLYNDEGALRGGVFVARDVTLLKQVEEALRESEERYRNIFNNAEIGLFQTSILDGTVIEANPKAARIFGYDDRESCIGDCILWERFVDPGAGDRMLSELNEKGEVGNYEARLARSDGSVVWVLITSRMYPEKGCIEGTLTDITEKKQSEQSLDESEEKYRLLVETANDGIFIIQDDCIQFLNTKMRRLMGLGDEEERVPYFELVHPDEREEVIERHHKRMKDEPVKSTVSVRYINRQGQELWGEVNAAMITWGGRPAALGSMRDITQQKKLEAQLRQAQKMEALGTMAGGLAHDFNNIIAAILGYAEIALRSAPDGSPLPHYLTQIKKGCRRAKDLVKQVLTFTRQKEQEKSSLKLSLIVKEGLKLIRATMPSNIEIRQEMWDKDSMVMADPTQIQQLLMNLCANAAYAMRENGGALEVSLQEEYWDEGGEDLPQGAAPGPFAVLTVKDMGCGMDRKTMERIFDPYFTTKGPGEGTGLGLAVVLGIVQNHGGGITVESTLDEGSTFRICFPCTGRQEQQPIRKTKKIESIPKSKGKESILFVDDEKGVLEIGELMLRQLGYRVAAKTSSPEALATFRANPNQFDLVITDQTMPYMTGDVLAKAMLEVRKDIPIILMTGFSGIMTKEKAEAIGIKIFMMKPFEEFELADAVRRVLDGDPQRTA